jgi:hypothetical protein
VSERQLLGDAQALSYGARVAGEVEHEIVGTRLLLVDQGALDAPPAHH